MEKKRKVAKNKLEEQHDYHKKKKTIERKIMSKFFFWNHSLCMFITGINRLLSQFASVDLKKRFIE